MVELGCGHENLASARDCVVCGARLGRDCGRCGGWSLFSARFCPSCGERFSEPIEAGGGFAPDGEYRRMTILFSDLSGSTELASRLDPEDFSAVIDRYYQLCGEAVAAHGGYLANYLGDGVLAYFGYPRGMDHSAAAAIRAGLDLQDRVAALNRSGGVASVGEIEVRVGIHTGRVVINEVGHESRREIHALGDVMNTAARVEGIVRPGGIAITPSTREAAGDAFEFRSLGSHALKGIAEPMELFEPCDPHPASVPAQRKSANFIGRVRELQGLDEAWHDVEAGHGRVITIVGGPGIGKSRLVEEFSRTQAAGVVAIRACATTTDTGTPFSSIRRLVEQHHGWTNTTTDEQRVADLTGTLDRSGGSREGIRALAPLLAPGYAVAATERPVSADRQRALTIDWLVTWFELVAQPGPTTLILEDLHWADPTTLEVLARLIDRLNELPLLILTTTRPGTRIPWQNIRDTSVIELAPLDSDDCRAIIADVTAGAAPAHLLVELAERAGGVAFFAVELARTVGRSPHGVSEIPATLHDLLTARLDDLGPARRVARVGAVLDDAFSESLAADILSVEPTDLADDFRRLIDDGLIAPIDRDGGDHYVWCHALLRQAAHDAMLRRDRRELHGRVAAVFADPANTHTCRSDSIAGHWSEAGAFDKAAQAWLQAGNDAMQVAAVDEASAHLGRVRETVALLDSTPESTEIELAFEMSFLRLQQMVEGFAAPAVLDTARRAGALADRIGSTHRRLVLLNSMWAQALSVGALENAHHLAGELLRAADSPAEQLKAHVAMLGTYCLAGDFPRAHPHSAATHRLLRELGDDVTLVDRVQARHYQGLVAASVGHSTEAHAVLPDLTAAAAEGGDAFVACLATIAEMTIWNALRDWAALLDASKRLGNLASTGGLGLFLGWADSYGGYAEIMSGRTDALDRLVDGLNLHLSMGHRLGMNQRFGLLAEAQLTCGLVSAARETMSRVAFDGEPALQRQDLSDCMRVDAEILRIENAPAEMIEERFREGLTIAVEIEARPRELRTCVGLARWLADEGRAEEAEQVLRTAGVDMITAPILVDEFEAVALLAQLG